VDDDAKRLNALMPEIMLEHQQMEALWQSLALQLKQVASGDSSALSADEVGKFVALYTSHMEKEETNIAPMAKRLFSPAQMAELGLAMRRRRGIDQ